VERLKEILKGKKEKEDVHFIRELLKALNSGENVYSDELLFRDAVGEVYSTLKTLVFEENRKDLIPAYEEAVLLKNLVGKRSRDPRDIIRNLIMLLEGKG